MSSLLKSLRFNAGDKVKIFILSMKIFIILSVYDSNLKCVMLVSPL